MRAATGRSDEVAVPIQDAVRLARSLDCLSTLITHCVLTHCTDTILDTVEYLLDVYDVPADTAAALVDAIGPLKDPDALFRTCVGELCFVITDWSSDLFCSERWREHMQRWMWCAFGFEKLYCLHFLIARAKQAALARLPRQERITAAKRAEERMRRGIPYPWLPLLFSSNWFEGEESRLKQCDQLETRLRAYAAG